MDLKNKVAIVTGASKGIGKAMVNALLQNGVCVAGWSRSEPGIVHDNFRFYKVDVRDEDAVENAFQQTTDEFGNGVDILINNAGLGIFGKIDETATEDWFRMFDTNVHGLFYCTRKVVAAMKNHTGGHIINIASIAGLVGVPEGAGYSATKFAVRGISQSLFKELREFNIKVSCIYPGSVNTHFFDHVDNVKANDTLLHPEDLATMMIQVLKMPDNFLTVDVEVRPMNPRYS